MPTPDAPNPTPPAAPTGAPSRRSARDVGIDTLRGVAIVLLVFLHAIPPHNVAEQGWTWNAIAWQALNLPLMPVFGAIAGFVYAMRPARRETLARFAQNKAARVLLPFIAATLLLYATRLLTNGLDAMPPTRLRDAFLLGSDPEVGEHLWFLPALLIVFAVVGALDVARMLDRAWVWAAVSLAAWAALPVLQGEQWLRFGAMWGAVYLLPPFLLGYGLQRHPVWMENLWVLAGAALLTVAAGAALVSRWDVPADAYVNQRLTPLAAWFTVPLCLLLLRFRVGVRWLAWLGAFSYGIYLYHGLGLAVHTRIDGLFGPPYTPLNIAARTCIGLAVPVAFELAARRVPYASAVLFGHPRRRKSDAAST